MLKMNNTPFAAAPTPNNLPAIAAAAASPPHFINAIEIPAKTRLSRRLAPGPANDAIAAAPRVLRARVFTGTAPHAIPTSSSIANDTGSNEYAVGPAHAQHAAATYFNMRKTSIYGGSNEIQRNIITKMILGL